MTVPVIPHLVNARVSKYSTRRHWIKHAWLCSFTIRLFTLFITSFSIKNSYESYTEYKFNNVFFMNKSINYNNIKYLWNHIVLGYNYNIISTYVFSCFCCTGVSVAVSCFTLVTISSERYFAICHPLRSRRWQTVSHSYKIIVAIWLVALIMMIPLATGTKLIELRNGNHACRDIWDSHLLEMVYTIVVVVILLVFPLQIMGVAYGLIIRRLWIDIKLQAQSQGMEVTPFQGIADNWIS